MITQTSILKKLMKFDTTLFSVIGDNCEFHSPYIAEKGRGVAKVLQEVIFLYFRQLLFLAFGLNGVKHYSM